MIELKKEIKTCEPQPEVNDGWARSNRRERSRIMS